MTETPHDALFKAAFEDARHAAGLLQAILPSAVVETIAWDTLTREPGSFVDPELTDRHTDMLFSARMGERRVLTYVLLEHKSDRDSDLPLQLLIYLVRIWEQFRREHPGQRLPLVIPVVVCHEPGGFRGPNGLHELFDPPPASIDGLAPLVPEFSFVLEDLAHLSDEELKARSLAAFPMLAIVELRDGRNRDRLTVAVEQWAEAYQRVAEAPSGLDALDQLLCYLLHMVDEEQYTVLRGILAGHVPALKEAVLTGEHLLQQLFERGQAKGLERGREEGREEGREDAERATLERQLTLKFGALPTEIVQRIHDAETEELERWLDRILFADSLRSVFAE